MPSRTFLEQDRQVRQSRTYVDTATAGVALQTGAGNLEDDLNAVRSQLRRLIFADSGGNWYADIPTVNGKKRAVLALNTDLDLIEEKKVLRRLPILTDIPVPSAQNWKILSIGGGEGPGYNAAVALTQDGVVVAQSSSFGPSFDTHELLQVAGPNAISPKNLLSVREAASGSPVQSAGRDVFGLFQYESTGIDGAAFNDSSGGNRVKISFVRLTAGLDSFEACPYIDIENTSINYAFIRRTSFKLLGEGDWLDDIAFLHSASGTGGLPDGAVTRTGPLSIQINSLFFELSGVKGSFAGATGVPVTDNSVNYVFLDSFGALGVNTVGYPTGVHIRLARVVTSLGTITNIFDERGYFTSVPDKTPNLSPFNKGMAALVTGGDGSLACSVAVAATPPVNGWISVFANGVSYKVGTGTKAGVPCYFSGDGGVTARATGAIVAGDFLYWNGSVANFQLDGGDRIDFEYEAL